MSKIPCEVVRDLFPSYIDELTSETTNREIAEHLEGCEACRKVLAGMKGDDAAPAPEVSAELKEIDFLKKNKKRNRRIVLGSIAGACLLFLLVLCLRVFVIGNRNVESWYAVNLHVNENELVFDGVTSDSASVIANVNYTEENGVVTMRARTVLASPLRQGTYRGTYTASEPVKEVRIGSRIVWSDGATVSTLASEVFETRHAYVGDMSANSRTAQALCLTNYLGGFTNELETAAEPYGWQIVLTDPVPEERLAQMERDMNAFGMVILGVVGNLDHVTFVYQVNGAQTEHTVTAAQASEFLGEDIKNCGNQVRTLDALIEKTGLSLYAFPKEEADKEEAWIRIVNQTDLKFQGVSNEYMKNGQSCSTGYMINADNSLIEIGETIWVPVDPMDFGGAWSPEDVLEVRFGFVQENGETIETTLRIAAAAGTLYDYVLTGEGGTYELVH